MITIMFVTMIFVTEYVVITRRSKPFGASISATDSSPTPTAMARRIKHRMTSVAGDEEFHGRQRSIDAPIEPLIRLSGIIRGVLAVEAPRGLDSQ